MHIILVSNRLATAKSIALGPHHLLLGVAYAFHVTLTWHILQSDQSDISEQGYIFSFVVIFLGNVTVLLVGIPLLASTVNLPTALKWWAEGTAQFVTKLIGAIAY